MSTRQSWVDQKDELALSRQCQLLSVTRSVIYEQKKRRQQPVSAEDQQMLRLLDEEYFNAKVQLQLLQNFLKNISHQIKSSGIS